MILPRSSKAQHLSGHWLAAFAWVPIVLGCGDRASSGGTSTSSATKPPVAQSAESSANAGTSAAPKPTAMVAASASASAAASAAAPAAPLTADEFCAEAAKIGETNYAKCPDSERAGVPCPSGLRPIDIVKDECSSRVRSTKVDFHGDAAGRCIEAAKKRGGKTTFCSFDEVAACSGVLTGKATDGQPALYAEECAKGFTFTNNHCVKPVAKNNACDGGGGGILGVAADHSACEEGLDCFLTKSSTDGMPGASTCLPPSDVGAACQLEINTCKAGSSCYQGKCRAQSAAGGDCMSARDCERGLECEVKGGAFGKCVERPLETCH